MEPSAGSANKPTNPLLAHLNDTDEAHASTRVDFLHPGEVVQPMTPAAPPAEAPVAEMAAAPKKAPEVPTPPTEAPPPPTQPIPAAPKSPRNKRPIIIIIVVVLLLLAAGGAAYWWFKIRQPASNSNPSSAPATQTITVTPVTPTGLAQKNSAGQAVAAAGALKVPLELDFTMNTSANSGSVEPQVEVEPLGTAFTNQPNYKGSAITPSGSAITAKVPVTDLKDGSYHWQARFVVGSDSSDWVPFATTSTTADFVIDSTAPKAPAVTSVGSHSVKTGATALTTTDNPTSISGTAEAGDTVAVAITPDNQSATATADANGKWTVTLTQALANGDHTVAITSSDPAGNTANFSFTISANTATAAPATQKVAPTGDGTRNLTLVGLALAFTSAAGLIVAGRRDQRRI